MIFILEMCSLPRLLKAFWSTSVRYHTFYYPLLLASPSTFPLYKDIDLSAAVLLFLPDSVVPGQGGPLTRSLTESVCDVGECAPILALSLPMPVSRVCPHYDPKFGRMGW